MPATPRSRPLGKRLGAELLGTFFLVLGGCGTAIFGARFTSPGALGASSGAGAELGVGHLGVALAFGLALIAMSYAVGHVSGAHFNPAVTLGLWAARRFDDLREVGLYVVAQLIGGLLAGAVLWGMTRSVLGSARATGNLDANGYDAHSPIGAGLGVVLLAEMLLTAFLVFVVLGVTTSWSPSGFEPLAVGFTYVVIHLISLPLSNTGVNPARSTAVAFFNGDGAPGQLWLFWVAPLVGAIIAGWSFEAITGIDRSNLDVGGEPGVAAAPGGDEGAGGDLAPDRQTPTASR